MNKKVLLDVSHITGYLLRHGNNLLVDQIFNLIYDKKISAFLPSSALPELAHVLEKGTDETKIEWRSELKTILSYVHILSVTGQDVLSALDKKGNFQHELGIESAMRIDSDMIALAPVARHSQHLQTTTLQKLIQDFSDKPKYIPIQIGLLDLSREYHLMMEEIDHAILSVAANSRFIMGPQVSEFEDKCATYIGSNYAVGTSSGTEALVIALRALAIQRTGMEFFNSSNLIITTPFTFTATGDSILRSGATPLFVDTEDGGFNLDTKRLKEMIDSSIIDPTQVAGILPVHLFGHPCQMDNIVNLAEKYNWFILEDVAQAFGAKWKKKRLGSIGTISAFSFFPTKNLGGFGDGGLITTDEKELDQLCRMLLRHGGKDKYNVDHIGYNARLDTIQAAVLLVRLKYLDQFNQKRLELARIYDQAFKTNQIIRTPSYCDWAHEVIHQYTVRLPVESRTAIQKKLERVGVSSAIYYPLPLHKMKVFKGRSQIFGSLSNSEKLCNQVLSLPIEPLMQVNESQHVVDSLIKFSQGMSE